MKTFTFVFLICCLTGAMCGKFYDIMKTGKKEWKLVFKGVGWADSSVYDAYTTGVCGSNPYTSECLKPVSACPCCSHYRDEEAMKNWSNIDQVAFLLYKDNIRVKEIIFNGKYSDRTSWFEKSRIMSTTFGGLSRSSTTNFFSIAGDAGLHRRFYINQNYGGCPKDCGWFVAVDRIDPPRPCVWEKKNNDGYPALLYSKKDDGCVVFQEDRANVGYADSFAVLVKYQKA